MYLCIKNDSKKVNIEKNHRYSAYSKKKLRRRKISEKDRNYEIKNYKIFPK